MWKLWFKKINLCMHQETICMNSIFARYSQIPVHICNFLIGSPGKCARVIHSVLNSNIYKNSLCFMLANKTIIDQYVHT